MTRHARCIDLRSLALAVAVVACRLAVRAEQREFHLAIVVERDVLPGLGRMTGRTILAETAFVHIIGPMTADASLGQAFIDLVRVAGLTPHGLVCALERELRPRMVERRDLGPAPLIVTTFASAPEISLMHVVLAMAGDALRRRLAELDARPVTRLAFGRLVTTPEQIVCQLVLKRHGIELHDVGVSPRMIGVAGLAGLTFDVRRLAVKSGGALDIRIDIRVTFAAEPGLRLLVERLMALVAALLELPVRLDELPRRHELLEDRLRSGRSRERDERQHNRHEHRTRTPRKHHRISRDAQRRCGR